MIPSEPVTVYLPIRVEDELPKEEANWHHTNCLIDGAIYPEGHIYSSKNKVWSGRSEVIEWLKPQSLYCFNEEQMTEIKNLMKRMYSYLHDDLSSDFLELKNDLPEWVTKTECNE